MSQPQNSRQHKIALIIEMCRDRLDAGKDVPKQTICAKYSDLMPELEAELTKLGATDTAGDLEELFREYDAIEAASAAATEPAHDPAPTSTATAARKPAPDVPDVSAFQFSEPTPKRKKASAPAVARRTNQPKSQQTMWLAISGGALALAVVVLVVVLLSTGSSVDDDLAAELAGVDDDAAAYEEAEEFDDTGFAETEVTDPTDGNQQPPEELGNDVESDIPLPGEAHTAAITDMIKKVDAANSRPDKLGAMVEATKKIQDGGKVDEHFSLIRQWYDKAQELDPSNGFGALETMFHAKWGHELTKATDLETVKTAVSELDAWRKKYDFRDKNLAARLHVMAAEALAKVEQIEKAREYIMIAYREYEPTDENVMLYLQQVASGLSIADGTGSGFAVADGGFIMTNHHVIEHAGSKPGSIKVQLPNIKDPVPAKLVAQDARLDMAIIKIDVPEGFDFKPIPISDASAGRGAPAAVFGFPGGTTLGKGLKLTSGEIAALPDNSNDGMYLLDCRVNPGNSGGPLCDKKGRCIGIVTAKTGGGGRVDSYGMARPSKHLRAFMQQHNVSFPESPELPDSRLEWDQVDAIVSGSVFMILIKR